MKNYLKLISKLLIAVLVVFGASAYASTTVIQPESATAANVSSVSYSFIQTAKSAVLKPDTAHPGFYKLILKHVNPRVAYFSDRPVRKAGRMPTEKFVALWQQKGPNSFSKDAPNAGFEAFRLKGLFQQKPATAVIALSNPVFNKSNSTLTYDAKILQSSAQHLPTNTVRFDHVSIFVDNYSSPCPSCCPNC